MLLGMKSKGGKSIKDRCLLQSLHCFNSLGNRCVSFSSRNLRDVNELGFLSCRSFIFLVLIEEKVVPRVSITSSIFSILEDFSSRDLIVSKVLTIFCIELSSLFKFPWILRSYSFTLSILGISSSIFSSFLIM